MKKLLTISLISFSLLSYSQNIDTNKLKNDGWILPNKGNIEISKEQKICIFSQNEIANIYKAVKRTENLNCREGDDLIQKLERFFSDTTINAVYYKK